MTLLESERAQIQELPPDILQKFPLTMENEFPLHALAAYGSEAPLKKDFQPASVSVFLNGFDEPSLEIIGDRILSADWSFFSGTPKSVVVLIDEIPRYAEINSEEVLNTIGDCKLPDVIVDPVKQIEVANLLLDSL